MPQSLPTPRPHEIEKTGDDTPASSLYRYVWRMSEWHQVWASLIAAATAALAFAPLELQRRIIDNAIETASTDILVMLSVVFLAVLLVQGGLKFALRIYQGWLSESAIRYTREHMSSIYAFRVASGDRAAFSPGKDDGDPQTSDDEAGDGDLERGGGTEAADGGRAVSIIGAEVDKLGAFVGEAFVAPVVNVGTVLALLGYMLYVDTWIALVSLIFLAPQIALTPLIQRRINRLTERRLSLMRELGGLVANEPRDSTLPDGEAFQSNIAGLFRNRMRIYLWKFFLKGVINLSNHLATLCVLLFGGWLAIQGETTVGVVVAFVSGFERIADPMRQVLTFYRTAEFAGVQHRMIARVL